MLFHNVSQTLANICSAVHSKLLFDAIAFIVLMLVYIFIRCVLGLIEEAKKHCKAIRNFFAWVCNIAFALCMGLALATWNFLFVLLCAVFVVLSMVLTDGEPVKEKTEQEVHN